MSRTMHSRSTIRRFLLTRATVLAAVAGLAWAGLSAPPAAAHDAPTPGSRCAMSGMTEVVHGVAYVCRSSDGTARWSRGLPTSRSPLTVTDGWIKAVSSGMTAAFGTVSNPTSRRVRIIGASSPLSAAVQLHEVVMGDSGMVMQERRGGFVIPAGGTLDLKPGGNHLMLMNVKRAITPGTLIPLTLITSTGGLIKTSVLAKTFSGAEEDYDPGMS